MKSGYPKQEHGTSDQVSYGQQQQYGQPVQQQQHQYLPPGADNVGREHSACQKQFNPGDETYRCIDCEITDDTPGEINMTHYDSYDSYKYLKFCVETASKLRNIKIISGKCCATKVAGGATVATKLPGEIHLFTVNFTLRLIIHHHR